MKLVADCQMQEGEARDAEACLEAEGGGCRVGERLVRWRVGAVAQATASMEPMSVTLATFHSRGWLKLLANCQTQEGEAREAEACLEAEGDGCRVGGRLVR